MKFAKFTIVGTSPFLFHRFQVGQIANKSKAKSGSKGNDPDEWRTTIFDDGVRLYIPKDYIFSCLMAGGQYVKVGKGSISKKLAGCMIVQNDRCYFNRELPKPVDEIENDELSLDSEDPIYLDIRGVKNPATKGKNVRYRLAMSKGWETDAEVGFDDTVISKDQFRDALESAGKFAGIGDARVIGNGRFEVQNLKFS